MSLHTAATAISLERIFQARLDHAALIQQFGNGWYHAPYALTSVAVNGRFALKCPMDLWMYYDLIGRVRPASILETGSADGGSGLWLAQCADLWGLDPSVTVRSVDVRPLDAPAHPRLTFETSDSVAWLARVLPTAPHPWLVSLDSAHDAAHVLREVAVVHAHSQQGDWCVVEDTNVTGDDGDPGPFAATEWLVETGHWARDLWCERWWLTMNPGGWMVRLS